MKNIPIGSPRKLHPFLRIIRAEQDWFTTLQKKYFLRVLMNIFLVILK